MDTNNMRDISLEQFKSWKGYPIPDLNSDGQFDKEYLQREWQAWQASRESVVVELPKEWVTNVGTMLPPPGVRRAIEAQGLKVAP